MLTLYLFILVCRRGRRPSAAPAKCKLRFADGTFCWGGKTASPQIYNVSDEDVTDVPKPNAPSEIIRRICAAKSKQNRCLIILIPRKRELS